MRNEPVRRILLLGITAAMCTLVILSALFPVPMGMGGRLLAIGVAQVEAKVGPDPTGDTSTEPMQIGEPLYQIGDEVIERRGENLKTYYLGEGSYRAVISGGIIHYKDDYADPKEQWKDIGLRWDGSRLDTAPYILEVSGDLITFTDKKTGDYTTIRATRLGETALSLSDKITIVPFNEGVKLQWQITESDVKDAKDETQALSAEFDVTVVGKSVTLRAQATDADGDPVPVEYEIRDGKFYETVKVDEFTSIGEKTAVRYPITVDPQLEIQPASKDTYLSEGAPTSNYGTEPYLYVRDYTGYTHRFILEFDISDLPAGATLDSAVFSLDYYTDGHLYTDPNGKSIRAYKLTRADWVEDEATWNIYKTNNNWDTEGGDYATSDPDYASTDFTASYGWLDWTVTDIVEDAVDNSNPVELLVRFATEGLSSGYSMAYFRSSDYTTDTSLRPKLVIDYTAPLTVTTSAADDITTTSFTANGEVTSTGGATITRRGFDYAPPSRWDDFEWGSDGDSIDTSGGGVTWVVTTAGDSTVKITTDQYASGTRSMEIFRASDNLRSHFTHTAGTGYSISCDIRKDTAAQWYVVHGNGTKRIIFTSNETENIYYLNAAGSAVDTTYDVTADTWHSFRVENIDWDTGTYDLYFDGTLIGDGIEMQPSSSYNGQIAFTNYAGTNSYVFVDNVAAWSVQDEAGSFGTGVFDESITGLSVGTSYRVRAFAENSEGIGYGSTVTATTLAVEITNTPDNYAFGTLALSTTSTTGLDYFTITNTGDVAVDITIQGTDMTGGDDTWTLSDTATPGENIYALKAGLDGGDYTIIVKKSATYNTLKSNLAEDATQKWGMRLWMPTSLSGYDNNQMTATVTLVASEAS